MLDAKDVKAAIPAEQFLHDRLPDMKPGTGWVEAGLCLFHDDKKAGSFYVHTETGASKCHSCGAYSRDIIDFAMAADGTDFPATIRNLAAEYGIADTEPTPAQREMIRKRQKAKQDVLLDQAIHHECHILMQTTGNRIASRQLERNQKFRVARMDWSPYPEDVWQREQLAAKRLNKALEVRYGI